MPKRKYLKTEADMINAEIRAATAILRILMTEMHKPLCEALKLTAELLDKEDRADDLSSK